MSDEHEAQKKSDNGNKLIDVDRSGVHPSHGR